MRCIISPVFFTNVNDTWNVSSIAANIRKFNSSCFLSTIKADASDTIAWTVSFVPDISLRCSVFCSFSDVCVIGERSAQRFVALCFSKDAHRDKASPKSTTTVVIRGKLSCLSWRAMPFRPQIQTNQLQIWIYKSRLFVIVFSFLLNTSPPYVQVRLQSRNMKSSIVWIRWNIYSVRVECLS